MMAQDDGGEAEDASFWHSLTREASPRETLLATLSNLEEEQQVALLTMLVKIQAILRGFLVRSYVSTAKQPQQLPDAPPPGLYQCIAGSGGYTTFSGKGIIHPLSVDRWKLERHSGTSGLPRDSSESKRNNNADESSADPLESVFDRIYPSSDAPSTKGPHAH